MINIFLYLTLHFFTTAEKASGEKFNKETDNPLFFDHENIALVSHRDENCDNDYSYYNTQNASRFDQTTFTMHGSTDIQATSILRLRQKVKRDKLTALQSHLNVAGDLYLISLDQINYAMLKITK